MTNYDDYLQEQMKDPEFKKEYDALDSEFTAAQAQIDAREAEAKERWGATEAYQEYEAKAAKQSTSERQAAADGLMALFAEFGKNKEKPASDPKVQTQVQNLKDYITAHFYTCTNEMLSQLGMMYAAGGEFTENIDRAGGAGTAEFVYHAIRYYCDTWAEKQPSFCFHRAVSVETLPGCCLRVVFRDGVVKTYDMKRLFDHLPQLKALEEDPLLFAAARVSPGGYGIIWNEDLDLDCSEIYVNGEDAV